MEFRELMPTDPSDDPELNRRVVEIGESYVDRLLAGEAPDKASLLNFIYYGNGHVPDINTSAAVVCDKRACG